jgi:hypothetical protein
MNGTGFFGNLLPLAVFLITMQFWKAKVRKYCYIDEEGAQKWEAKDLKSQIQDFRFLKVVFTMSFHRR